MEMKVQVPFQELLTIVKTLTPTQKAKLRAELDEVHVVTKKQDEFIEFLLSGPIYSEEELDVIVENTKSIAAWRTKN